MNYETVMQAITTVGFPIAMCLILYCHIQKQDENHKAEIDKLSDAVSNNTLVLQKLCDILDRKG